MISRVAGANVPDPVRTARQLATKEFAATGDLPCDLVVVGRSQGAFDGSLAGGCSAAVLNP